MFPLFSFCAIMTNASWHFVKENVDIMTVYSSLRVPYDVGENDKNLAKLKRLLLDNISYVFAEETDDTRLEERDYLIDEIPRIIHQAVIDTSNQVTNPNSLHNSILENLLNVDYEESGFAKEFTNLCENCDLTLNETCRRAIQNYFWNYEFNDRFFRIHLIRHIAHLIRITLLKEHGRFVFLSDIDNIVLTENYNRLFNFMIGIDVDFWFVSDEWYEGFTKLIDINQPIDEESLEYEYWRLCLNDYRNTFPNFVFYNSTIRIQDLVELYRFDDIDSQYSPNRIDLDLEDDSFKFAKEAYHNDFVYMIKHIRKQIQQHKILETIKHSIRSALIKLLIERKKKSKFKTKEFDFLLTKIGRYNNIDVLLNGSLMNLVKDFEELKNNKKENL